MGGGYCTYLPLPMFSSFFLGGSRSGVGEGFAEGGVQCFVRGWVGCKVGVLTCE